MSMADALEKREAEVLPPRAIPQPTEKEKVIIDILCFVNQKMMALPVTDERVALLSEANQLACKVAELLEKTRKEKRG